MWYITQYNILMYLHYLQIKSNPTGFILTLTHFLCVSLFPHSEKPWFLTSVHLLVSYNPYKKSFRINVDSDRLESASEATFHDFVLTPSVYFLAFVVFKGLSLKRLPVLYQVFSTSVWLTFCANDSLLWWAVLWTERYLAMPIVSIHYMKTTPLPPLPFQAGTIKKASRHCYHTLGVKIIPGWEPLLYPDMQ